MTFTTTLRTRRQRWLIAGHNECRSVVLFVRCLVTRQRQIQLFNCVVHSFERLSAMAAEIARCVLQVAPSGFEGIDCLPDSRVTFAPAGRQTSGYCTGGQAYEQGK